MKCKKLLSLLLALVLALGCVGTAFAVEVTEVSTIPELYDAIDSGKSDIKLGASFEYPGAIDLKANLNLYLNGETLTLSMGQAITCCGYTLNIYGGATAGDTNLSGTLATGKVYLNGSGGTLNVYSGTVNAIQSDQGTVNISGGTVNELKKEAGDVSISGGYVTIVDADECGAMFITGGYITLNADTGEISPAVSITGGYFNMDVSSRVTAGYLCVANTDSATKAAYPYKVVPGCYLDLDETDATYPIKKDIDQNYTLAVTENYTDKTKVKLTWTVTDIAASYTSDKTWDPDTLSWTESKTAGTPTGGTAEFTLTNYSSKQVAAAVSFAAESAVASTYDEANSTFGSCVLNTPVTKSDATYQDSQFTALKQTINAALAFNKDAFTGLAAAAGAKYGTYTVTLKKAYCVTVNYYVEESDTEYTTATYYVGEGTAITAETNTIAIGDNPAVVSAECNNNGYHWQWIVNGQYVGGFTPYNGTVTSDITIEPYYQSLV